MTKQLINPGRDVWLAAMNGKLALMRKCFGARAFECPVKLITDMFNVVLYDDNMSELFAEKIIATLEAIRDRTTFKFIEDRQNYIDYLTVVNLGMIFPLVEWGGSIRGAWFDLHEENAFSPEEAINKSDMSDMFPRVTTEEGMGEFIHALRMFKNQTVSPTTL